MIEAAIIYLHERLQIPRATDGERGKQDETINEGNGTNRITMESSSKVNNPASATMLRNKD